MKVSALFLLLLTQASALAPSYERNHSILQQSLSSIANKLTLSPEIIIPEPSDPTALLLQKTEIEKMSNALRVKAKANAAFLSGSVGNIATFCNEQETARGNFPGPLPIIYCGEGDYKELAEKGTAGVLFSLNGEISDADSMDLNGLKDTFEQVKDCGMALIPELILSKENEWSEDDLKAIVDKVVEECEGNDPAAILLTLGAIADEEESGEVDESDDESDDDDVAATAISLPSIAKDLSNRIPILGSVRAVAGGGRMGSSVNAHKDVGFKGCVLRCDCLPGFRMNPDLDFVGGFWGAAIGDLKSTKSKNFNFRSTIALDRDIPMEWFNYQKDVMESGALGSPSGGGANPIDSDNGDYVGF